MLSRIGSLRRSPTHLRPLFASEQSRANVTMRHNRKVWVFARELRRASRCPIIESKKRRYESSQPEIWSLGKVGGDDLIRATIVYPFSAPGQFKMKIIEHFFSPRYAYNRKIRQRFPLLYKKPTAVFYRYLFRFTEDGRSARKNTHWKLLKRRMKAAVHALDTAHQFFPTPRSMSNIKQLHSTKTQLLWQGLGSTTVFIIKNVLGQKKIDSYLTRMVQSLLIAMGGVLWSPNLFPNLQHSWFPSIIDQAKHQK